MQFKKDELIKSPLNYTGGKFKLLPQILPLFPDNINTFVDLFGGGGNVCINVKANRIYYNDYIKQLSDMLNIFKTKTLNELLNEIDNLINEFQLSKENQDGFIKLREYYNNMDNKQPVVLYTIICYAFNNQIRFNSKGEFNMPFGKDRSSFNDTLRDRFCKFINEIHNKNCNFLNFDFRELKIDKLSKDDLVYCDPPYLITTASYNENGGWGEKDEVDLLDLLDKLNGNNVKFALSNILERNGKSNDILKEWCKKYNVHYLNNTYNNCSYHKKDRDSKDVEVLITNYE